MLGMPVSDGLQNELIEAPEVEEVFDVLNDETFGNCESGWDEEEHKRLAGLDYVSILDYPQDHTKDSGYGNAERSYRSQEEIFLEQSIIKIVDEEDNDKNKNIITNNNCGLNFRQCGELTSDHVWGRFSPTSIFGSNLVCSDDQRIWGTPLGDGVFEKPINALEKLFRSVRLGDETSSPGWLPKDPMHDKCGSGNVFGKQKVVNAEDLERRLRGEAVSSASFDGHRNVVNHHPSIGPPAVLPQSLGLFSPVEALLADCGVSTPSSARPLAHCATSPEQVLNKGVIPIRRSLIPPVYSSHPGSAILTAASGRRTSTPTTPREDRLQRPAEQEREVTSRRLLANKELLPQSPLSALYNLGWFSGLRNLDHCNDYIDKPQHPGILQQQSRWCRSYAGEDDEYCGLMTQKEKDWIIRIQLMQINTDNPYLHDYYYTYYVLKQKQRENGNIDGFERFIIPNLSRIESRSYTPAQFEGSLGRLTFSSVHNPRPLIDIERGPSSSEDDGSSNVSKELRRIRQLLMDIEKGYLILLDVDDIEKKILATDEDSRNGIHHILSYMYARLPLIFDRFERICQLYQYFTSDETIQQYMKILGVGKGRKLLARVLPLFNKKQGHVALCIMFHHMHNLVLKDSSSSDGLSCLIVPVCEVIGDSDLESFGRLVSILHGERSSSDQAACLQPFFSNKFGAVVLCSLMDQAERFLTSVDVVNSQFRDQWDNFLAVCIQSLESSEIGDLSFTSCITVSLSNVLPHLRRQLDSDVFSRVEGKLLQLLPTLQPATMDAGRFSPGGS